MLKLKLQYVGHLMRRTDSFEKTVMLENIEGRRRRERQRMRWLDGIINGRRFGWTLGVGDGQGGLVYCVSWGREEWSTTEWLHFHFSLSCIGEGNGNPLQCSCLENPWDGGAWWAAICGVAQSRTRLKRLSSSSSCTSPFTKCSVYVITLSFSLHNNPLR